MNKIESLVGKKYDRLASIYDRRWQSYISNSLAFLVGFADIPAEAAVLDLACGTGELTQLILKKNSQQNITGVDISQAMLAIARQKLTAYPNVNFHNATATSLPVADNSFDLVICANAFHYFSSPEAVLLEIRRVLKPQGQVIILDWCRDYFPLKIGDRLFKLIDSAYQQCYTQNELEKILLASSFTLVKDSKARFDLIWELMAVKAISSSIYDKTW
ncbi:MAG: class I SAM-dependent methyltransferase [Cyanobacteria bacterium J06631_2]